MVRYDVIQATPEFRKSILALLVYSDWLVRYGDIIKPEFFPTDDEKDFVKWVNSYFVTYRDAPDETSLEQGLIDNPVVPAVKSVDFSSLDYAADTALEFAKVQAMKIAILQSVEDIKEGDLQRPLTRVKEALKVGDDRLNLGMDLVEDVEDWVYDELQGRKFPTGWTNIDNALDGGVMAGEMAAVMAPSGYGKTTCLVEIGFSLAGLYSAANVLHVTHEISAEKVLRRYGARVSGIRVKRGDSGKAFISQFRNKAKATLRGKLRVVYMPSGTCEDVFRLVDSLTAEGFEPDVLIDDYPELLEPVTRRKERRFEIADTYRAFRAWAGETGKVVWGASQTGRHTFGKEVITEKDIAEAIEKVAILDLLIAICQTPEERTLGHGRLFTAKIRDGKSHFFVPVKIDFENQSVVQRISGG